MTASNYFKIARMHTHTHSHIQPIFSLYESVSWELIYQEIHSPWGHSVEPRADTLLRKNFPFFICYILRGFKEKKNKTPDFLPL